MQNELIFSPAEAAAISGVSTDLQRDWRRRGLLAAGSSARARYTLDDIAIMYVMTVGSSLGPIGAVAPLAAEIAPALSAYAVGEGDKPDGAAAVMRDGGFQAFPSLQAAVDALEAEGAPVLRVLPFDFVATPFKIRVRKALEARGVATGLGM